MAHLYRRYGLGTDPAIQKEFGKEYIDAIAVSTPYVSKRPKVEERLFRSKAVEKTIREIKKKLKDAPYLAWMFENCFPNTLDTTVHYEEDADGNPDTFVYTGDIHAMWGRDSGAQVSSTTLTPTLSPVTPPTRANG